MNEMLRRRPAIARIASVLGTGCLLGCNVQVNDVNHGSQLGYAHSNSAQIKVDSGQHTVTSPSIGNGSIAGVVNDEHGQGIAHTRVQLRNDVSGKTLIETLTSADGRFAFTNLANQRYVLWANNMAYVADQAGRFLEGLP